MSDSAEDWRHTLTVSGSRTGGYEEKGKDKNGECLDASHYTTTHSEQLMLKVDIDSEIQILLKNLQNIAKLHSNAISRNYGLLFKFIFLCKS